MLSPRREATTSDGSLVLPPWVSDVRIATEPQNGTAYGAGEWIRAWVRFDREIEVSGTPQLGITIGDQTRQANRYATSRTILWFRYAVQSDDLDSDGVGGCRRRPNTEWRHGPRPHRCRRGT